MTLQECYQQLGGDLQVVKTRLPSDNLIKKFVTMFLDDSSFSELCQSMQDDQIEIAFRAAHTLKGVCANLGFNQLEMSASDITELLRHGGPKIPGEAVVVLEEVKQDYELTVGAIRAYLET